MKLRKSAILADSLIRVFQSEREQCTLLITWINQYRRSQANKGRSLKPSVHKLWFIKTRPKTKATYTKTQLFQGYDAKDLFEFTIAYSLACNSCNMMEHTSLINYFTIVYDSIFQKAFDIKNVPYQPSRHQFYHAVCKNLSCGVRRLSIGISYFAVDDRAIYQPDHYFDLFWSQHLRKVWSESWIRSESYIMRISDW